MRFLLVILLVIGCNIENNSVSITANTADPNNSPDGTNTINEGDPPNNNGSSQNSSLSLTFTPKDGNAGDEISLNDNIALLVNVNNTSSSEVTGELTLSGADASKLELINVSGFTQNGDGLSYTISASGSAKLLVVRKSNYSDSLTAVIQDNAEDAANITTTALGYNILFWFNPRDITLANVNDADASGDLSNGDTLNTLPDRSGNNRVLSKANSNNLATYISSGQNAHPNIDLDAWIGGGTDYIYTSSTFLEVTSGDDIIFTTSLFVDNDTQRQDFKFYNPGYGGSPFWFRDIHGIDLNTHNTQGQKHGTYIAGSAQDASLSLTSKSVNIMLFLDDTTTANSVIGSSTYYVDNTSYALSTRSSSSYSNGNFYTYIEQGKIIHLRMNAKIYDAMIVNGSEITEAQRVNLNCYLALKNNVGTTGCL